MTNPVAELLATIVKIDSPTDQEEAFANYLLSQLKPLITKVKKDSFGNIYAYLEGHGQPLFFSAHMDTVEPGRGIQPLFKDGYIKSDGTTILGGDDKAAIAAILHLLTQLPQDHRPLELIFTRSEESGNYGAINFDYSLLKSKQGYVFDASQEVGTVIQSSPYYERFDITLQGQAAHASRPEQAINALTLLSQLLTQQPLGRVDSDTLINIGIVSGGHVRNTIPGELTLAGEIRGLTEPALLSHKNHLQKTLESITKSHHAQFTAEFVRENPGYKFTRENGGEFYLSTEQKIIQAGLTPHFEDYWGVSDANIFNDQGLQCFNMGIGVENPHTTDERISIKQLETLVHLMEKLITDQ